MTASSRPEEHRQSIGAPNGREDNRPLPPLLLRPSMRAFAAGTAQLPQQVFRRRLFSLAQSLKTTVLFGI
jgi:hypothetical protein